MQERLKPWTIIAIITVIASFAMTYWAINIRIDSLEKNQISKEDIRQIVKDNNSELMTLIDAKIALAIQKKNNE